jgi:2-succinyl-5-enolpyruvyl-6-hydroxy-3-cyclohexene-1-carboxylate synthase
MKNIEKSIDLLRKLMSAGVEEFCLCSGSRNAPLISVIARTHRIKTYSFFDERSAAFFALGRMQDTRKPVAVVSTSGTAVAEMLPACVEAHYQRLPLIIISADRPKRYRGTGAPQSIEQHGIFSHYVEASWDVDVADNNPNLGAHVFTRPVHINMCFEEPLLDQEVSQSFDYEIGRPLVAPPANFPRTELENFLRRDDSLLILLGALSAEEQSAVKEFCLHLKAPIWAECLSGLREDRDLARQILKAGENLLSKSPWKRVLRLGSVPSCRFWRDLEKRNDIDVCSISREGFAGLARSSLNVPASPSQLASVLASATPSPAEDKFYNLDQLFRQQLQLLIGEYPKSEVALLSFLSQRIGDHSSIFLGNSLIIREWNLGARYSVEKREHFANRGANGIDGEISSYLGVSAKKRSTSWGIFGDITALYDLNAPWVLKQLGGKPHGIVIINNSGGKLFSRVKDLKNLDEVSRRLVELPHEMDFSAWSKMWKLDYLCVREQEEFRVPSTSFVMEIQPDPVQSQKFWASFDKLWDVL